ncbi:MULTISPECIES: hypothetical protein [unclassified Micromonospora]|uniref:hypothetical protein n=1 Tax=unclassified Micromonospora TaxID=2617518 RepID=UPI003319B299
MTPGDVARLLGTCALYDYRETSKHDAVAWYAVIGDLDFEEASEAVRRHYRDSTERIMPAHVRAIVKQIREEQRRLEQRTATAALPSKFEEDMNRQVRLARGGAQARQILEPLIATIAARQESLPSAFQQLRELTAGAADAELDPEGQS